MAWYTTARRASKNWYLQPDHDLKTSKELVQDMVAAGYTDFAKGATKDVLENRHIRMQRQLLCYSKCTVQELKRFVIDRGLAMAPKQGDLVKAKPNSSKELIKLLEDADMKPSFDRFQDLPIEVQTRICKLHMEDFPDTLTTPVQPHITRTSRQLRQIALPVFYSSKTFTLGYAHRRNDPLRPMLSQDHQLWVLLLTPESIASIRSLQLDLPHPPGTAIVELDKTVASYTIHSKGGDNYSMFNSITRDLFRNERERRAQEMAEKLREWAEKIEWVDGMKRMKVEDIYAIRRAIVACEADKS